MKKLANMPMDVVDEVLQEDVDKLLNLIEDLPESVKTAHIPTTEEINDMDESSFAAVMFHPQFGFMKKFANNNPEMTQLNSKLFLAKEHELPNELCKVAGANLYRAYSQFKVDIPEGLEKYSSEEYVPNVVDLTEVDEVAYAKKLEQVDNVVHEEKLAFALPSEEKFPIHDELHQKTADKFFNENSMVLDIPTRIEYAKNLEKQAEEVSPMVEKYASFDLDSTNDEIDVNIRARKRLLNLENHKYIDGLMDKMANITPLQTCMYLEEIDKQFGLDHVYGKHIEDAPSSVFSRVKEATEGGITQSDLDQIVGHEKFASWVDESLGDALKSSKGLHVFSLIPNGLQDRLKELL